jgi:hypothetical protein
MTNAMGLKLSWIILESHQSLYCSTSFQWSICYSIIIYRQCVFIQVCSYYEWFFLTFPHYVLLKCSCIIGYFLISDQHNKNIYFFVDNFFLYKFFLFSNFQENHPSNIPGKFLSLQINRFKKKKTFLHNSVC